MKKFKIVTQRVLFGGNEKITEENRTKIEIVEADSFIKNKDEVAITNENIDFARKHINSSYNIGDIHYSPVNSISFFIEGIEIKKIKVLADPYYELYEFINDMWVLVDKHKCN